jgi:hypothetical protein
MELDRREAILLGGGTLLAGAFLLDGSQKAPACSTCDEGTCPVDCLPKLPTVKDLPRGAYTGVTMDLPHELREPNWGGGSCVHASNVMVLRWQGQYEMADWWRKNYSGGENDTRLVARLEAAGLRYAWGRDESFLDWTSRTRRGAGIFYKPNHSICMVGIDSQNAYLLDNNDIGYPERNGHYETVPRAEFIQRWHGYGSFGWTMVYEPPPAEPTV